MSYDPSADSAPQADAPTMQDVLGGSATPPPTSVTNPAPTMPAPSFAPIDGKPALWRGILAGALSGLAGSAGQKSFGGGLAAGAGAALEAQRQQSQDQTSAEDRASQIKFRDAQSAQLVAEAHLNDYKLSALPQELQDQHNSNALATIKDLQALGVSPVASGPNTGTHAEAALASLTQSHGTVPSLFTVNVGNQVVAYDLNALTQDNDNGNLLSTVNKYGRALGRPDLTASQWAQMPTPDRVKIVNDSLGALQVVPDPSKIQAQIATAQNMASTYALQPQWKQDPDITKRLNSNIAFLQNAQKQFDAHQVSQESRVAGAKASAEQMVKNAGNSNSPWVPKVGADEKKKAELAENIASNANDVASILLKRPDMVGAVAGRFTSIEQMMGNNDPDIAALATHIHNIAMANSGVHGFRSQEGVESFEKVMLNNFKNGPKAIAGALAASASSVQTFIDNARPDSYKTHSKQGGALRGMAGR